MLNKEIYGFVLNFYKASSVRTFVDNHSKQAIIKALDEEPNLRKYYQNKKSLKNIINAFGSNVFGGSVFNPIRAASTGLGGMREKGSERKIQKSNNLVTAIRNMDLSAAKSCRFYILKNIKTPENNFIDI